MTLDRLWHGTPLVRSWPVKAALLAALAAAVFFLPYHVPIAPSISLSYVLQYSNRAALLLFTAGTLAYALLTGGLMGHADAEDKPLTKIHLAAALPLILLLTTGQALRSLSKSAGVESLYAINRITLLTDGLTPFTGFSYTYGPLELYPPLWLHQFTGRPITTTYYVWLILQWLLGTAMLWFTVRHLSFRIRWRPVLFWILLELCLVVLPSDGTTYNPIRLIGTAFAAVCIAQVHARWRNGYATAAVALLLIAVNLAISVDLGLAIAAGTLLWFVLLRWKHQLLTGPLLLTVSGVAAILLASKQQGWFIAASMFGVGAYNLPLLPTVHIALTLFVYIAAACAAVLTWRKHQWHSAALPMAFIGLAGLPGAFGRADEVHLRISSAAFILGLAYIQQQTLARRLFTTIATVSYLLPITLSILQQSRHQASLALHTLAYHHIHHPYAIPMQGEPSMDGLANLHHWPLFFASNSLAQLRPPCPQIYFAPTLTPPRGISPAQVCLDTGQFKTAGNLFTSQAIQLKVDELLTNRRPLLLLDTTLADQLPTIEDDPATLPRVQGWSPLHPTVKRAALTYPAHSRRHPAQLHPRPPGRKRLPRLAPQTRPLSSSTTPPRIELTMRAEALQLTDTFSLDALQFRTLDIPDPAPDEVLVRIRAVSLNYRDLLLVRGHYNPRLPKPRTLCSDAAGEVVSTGSAVTTLKPGDRVTSGFFLRWLDGPLTDAAASSALGDAEDGVLTTYRLFPATALVPISPNLTFEQAATLPCAGVTAWNALVRIGNIGPGDTALFLGTGGVSMLGLQIAHLRGATTLVTSSSQTKLDQARALGATHTIHTSTHPDWARTVRDLTGGTGATHILEVGGAGTLPSSLKAAARNGLIAMIGVLSGVEQPVNVLPILMNGLRIQGVFVGSVRMLAELAQTFAAANLAPVVGATFPFHAAKDALRTLDSATHFGKIVITLHDASN